MLYPDGGVMSLTTTVPPAVPSVFQREVGWPGARAPKNTCPFDTVRYSASEELPGHPLPGWRSTTMWVPASVPSVTYTSRPWTKSSAVNTILSPRTAYSPGLVPNHPGRMSLTIRVPAAVPSVFQTSASNVAYPGAPWWAAKYTSPFRVTHFGGAVGSPGMA